MGNILHLVYKMFFDVVVILIRIQREYIPGGCT